MRKGLLIFFCVSMLAGCREPAPQHALKKMDAPLRAAVAERADGVVPFSGRCDREIDEAMRVRMEGTGVALQTVVREHFTARGKAEQILNLAHVDFIVRLESGKQVRPLDKT